MNVTQITAPITLDSIRLTVESMMRNRVAGLFAFISGISSFTDAPPIAESGDFRLVVPAAPTGLTSLTYTLVGGRFEITGLTTDNLPNGRRFWTSFGQLCEDVFFGRIPELVSATALVIDQSAGTIKWSNFSDLISDAFASATTILTASEVKQSADFFE